MGETDIFHTELLQGCFPLGERGSSINSVNEGQIEFGREEERR
jgi:hypothetical protein